MRFRVKRGQTSHLAGITLTALALAAPLGLFGGSADAGSLVNGGFETGGLSGWESIGDAGVVGSGFGTPPAEGSWQAGVSNHRSPSSSVFGGSSVPDAALEGFLGLASGSLDSAFGGGTGAGATEGSAIKQEITVAAGDTLTAKLNFLTSEATPSSPFNDTSFFASVDGLILAANTFGTFGTSGTPLKEETGYFDFSYTFTSSGTFTVGFGVVDVAAFDLDSALLVDNVALTAVPIPAALPLFLSAIAGLGLLGQRGRNHAAA